MAGVGGLVLPPVDPARHKAVTDQKRGEVPGLPPLPSWQMLQRRIGRKLTKNLKLEQVGGLRLSPGEIARTEQQIQWQLRNFGLRVLREEGLLNSAGLAECARLELEGFA